MSRASSVVDRFFDGIQIGHPNDCWPWVRACSGKGYGQMSVNKHLEYTHRLAYRLLVGSIPDGLFVLHHCDNPPCANPGHLFLGTNQDNMQDAARKGRTSNWFIKYPSDLCQRGHAFDRFTSRRRYCQRCRTLRQRERRGAALASI
ncbi:hypothetical protein LCGC14_0409910 [marine sediment metagenome]|uniref:HNH nuclease domain-containing protein n=1 Tax=marine sediment metagenome TaxID=412755 RepID=A0A0F9TC12_9ZZZZ